jgi:tRNA-Thr(GGU) m(6)t(6)A37 methyltransferase TsaA
MDIQFKPIGVTHTNDSDAVVRETGGVAGELEIYPEFADGLDGIDGYSHLFVIVYFDRLRAEQIGPLKVRPRGLLRRGFKLEDLPLLGVFALDSPTRPNPIGLTLVRVLKREGGRIFVTRLDFFDGTPIIDLKGYRPQYRVDNYELPEWHHRLADDRGHL